MDSSAGLFMLLLMFSLVAMGFAWHFHRSRSLLERWAERNGCRILAAEYRHVFRGPFFWTSSKGQTVYRVTVEVPGGVRTGWVRCGSWWFGLLSDRAEVRWNEEPTGTTKWDEAPAGATNSMHDQWIDG
jgi:hypothetical protein